MDKERYGVFSIANKPNSDFDIVFIHGLGGDKYTTWQNSESESWFNWLALDYNVSVHTIAYGANLTNWIEDDMTLENSADFLLSSLHHKGIGKKPYMFVVHSLGGLLAKRILLKAHLQNDYQDLSNMCKAIVFFGVPHTGSGWASLLNYAKPILRNSNLLKALPKDTDSLHELALDFDNFMVQKEIETFVFYETKEVRASGLLEWLHLKKGIIIVSQTSATHVHSNNPKVSLPEDHISICKIPSKDSDIYQTKIASIMNKMFDISNKMRAEKELEEELKQESEKQQPTTVTQTHHSSGDNVGGDKIVNDNSVTIGGSNSGTVITGDNNKVG